MKPARIILADEHTILLDALKNLLQPEFEVVGTFSDGHTLLEDAPGLNPDVVVLDIGMPMMNGLVVGKRLKQVIPRVKLIYLTMNQDPDVAAEALRLGALGYILKNSAASELIFAIREALLGRNYVTQLMTKDIVDSFILNHAGGKNRNKLTIRQKEVLQLLAEGRTMKEVAYILDITPRTVAFHKYTMMEQLQIKSSAELIQFAMKSSIVPA
jgi:DNA-binding NarL/FixJ family response regulator